MKRGVRAIALLSVLVLVGAACRQRGAGGGDGAALPGEGVLGCLVTDTGGVDDRSFNQAGYEGLERAQEELGVEIAFLESQTEADYEPNIRQFIDRGCDLIIPQGFKLEAATAVAAEANPGQNFAIIDVDFLDAETGEDITYDNVKELTFQTDEAAFLAGYLAAGMTQTGRLGTYGGLNIPTVTIFMNGFAAGMAHHNAEKGTNVELLGWDAERQDGLFVDPTFEDQDAGRRTGEDLISEGADIIMPVSGKTGLGTIAAAQDAGNVNMIWVDVDGCVLNPDDCPIFITSVKKEITNAVFTVMEEVVNGEFEGGLYVGTLENQGVGLAPYNEFEDDVPDELKQEIETLKQEIIDGTRSVDPADYA
jgi:basic membrane protein A and related proteins